MTSMLVRILLASVFFQTSSTEVLNFGPFKSLINKIIDVTIADIVDKYQSKEDGALILPTITHEFSSGATFVAANGIFRDLRTFHRSKDIIVSKVNNKYEVTCGVELRVANLHFSHYELTYLGVSVTGSITGSVDGVVLQAKVSADYANKPCQLKVEEIEITEFGEIEIDFTGLGLLTKLLSVLVEFFGNFWSEKIVSALQDKIKEVVANSLSKVDCEKYRP